MGDMKKGNREELVRIFNLAENKLGKEYKLERNQYSGYEADYLTIQESGELENVTISIVKEKGKIQTFINIWAYAKSDWNAKYIAFLEKLKNEKIWINLSDYEANYDIEEAIYFIEQTHLDT